MAVLAEYTSGNESYALGSKAMISAAEAGQSIMARKQAMRLREQQEQREQAEFAAKLPLLQATAQLARTNAAAAVDNATRQTQLQTQAASASVAYQNEFNDLIRIPDWEEKATALEEFQAKVAWMGDLKNSGYSGFVEAVSAARNQAEGMTLVNKRIRMGSREFDLMTQGLSEEEIAKARRVKLGLDGRASGAAIQYREVVGPDGRAQLVAVDPRSVGAQIIGSGQTYGSGVGATQESRSLANGESVASENRFISQTPSDRKQQETEGVKKAEYAAKLRQDRPKREAALNQAEVLTEQMTEGIDELIGKVSAETAGPGGVLLSKFPGTAARDFQANLDSIKANIGFKALQAMREASPTGGALGQVVVRELELLQATLGSLEVGQSPEQLRKNLKRVRQRISQNYALTRGAFATEYGGESAEAQAAGVSGLTPEEQREKAELEAKLRQ